MVWTSVNAVYRHNIWSTSPPPWILSLSHTVYAFIYPWMALPTNLPHHKLFRTFTKHKFSLFFFNSQFFLGLFFVHIHLRLKWVIPYQVNSNSSSFRGLSSQICANIDKYTEIFALIINGWDLTTYPWKCLDFKENKSLK